LKINYKTLGQVQGVLDYSQIFSHEIQRKVAFRPALVIRLP
jgi:hypothetical protein